MEIIDSKVTPACVTVNNGLLFRQALGYGTFQKGPGVEITNNCDNDLQITSFMASENEKDKLKPLKASNGVLVFSEAKEKQYKGIDISEKGEECSSTSLEESEKNLTCNAVLLKKGEQVIVPMKWGQSYQITGKKDVDISGKMINPDDPDQAIEWYKKKAATGDIVAMEKLGYLYFERAGKHRDPSTFYKPIEALKKSNPAYPDMLEAVKWYEGAADKGSIDAMLWLGQLYGNWLGQTDKAAKWYRTALRDIDKLPKSKYIDYRRISSKCALGNIELRARNSGDAYSAALKWFEVETSNITQLYAEGEQGQVKAQVALIHLLSKAIDECHNADQRAIKEEKFKWVEKAALQDDPEGQYYMGQHYQALADTGQKLKTALEWYGKAAAQGHVEAKFHIGVIYSEPYNFLDAIKKDENKELTLIREAAEEGSENAQQWVANYYYYGQRPGYSKDWKETYYWLSLAKKNGGRVSPWMYDNSRKSLGVEEIAAIDRRVENWKSAPVRKLQKSD